MDINLGCPYNCTEWTCIDIHPKDKEVIEDDAINWLKNHANTCEKIKSFNLIEHLSNVGLFFEFAYQALMKDGILILRTDNAEWFPFYISVIHRLGWGAHSSDKYCPEIMNDTKHYSVFTKMHLRHYASRYGFKIISLRRVTFGARLLGEFLKE